MKLKSFVNIAVGLASVVSFVVPAGAQTAATPPTDWRQAVLTKLQSRYKLTKVTADKTTIVTAGSVVVLKKDNLGLFSTESRNTSFGNSYVNGSIKGPFLFSVDVRNGTGRQFVAGEKLWLTKILFEPKNDGIVLEFLSDPFNDVRYSGTLKFPFAKGAPQPSPDNVAALVDQVIEPDSSQAAPPPDVSVANPPPPPPPAVAVPDPPPAPPAKLDAPPPPPDAPPAEPPTVKVGQTRDQVIAIMGQPKTAAKTATREILIYKDFKVTLTAGKVTNIE
jgi:hypothetical protein